MSGHSKWSKVKHQKAVTDAVKSQAFTKAAHGITLAVRSGGGVSDPNFNFHLRLAIDKAKSVNMPKENIEKAINKGKGLEADNLIQMDYEAYGPGGSAIVISTATDNHNRTTAEIKNILDRNGARLVAPGSVSHLFNRTGFILVNPAEFSEDRIMNLCLDSGADDMRKTDRGYIVYSSLNVFNKVRDFFQKSDIPVVDSGIILKPVMEKNLNASDNENLSDLINILRDHPEVIEVYTDAD